MNEELYKGLTSASSSGGAWQDRDLNPILTDAAQKKRPILKYLNMIPATGNPHKFRRRDKQPFGHWEGDNATSVETQSSVSMQEVDLKICRSKGFVTDFLAATMGPDEFDVALEEILAHTENCAMQIAAAILWGCDGAASTYTVSAVTNRGNAYMPAGFDADANIYRQDGGGNAMTLAEINALIDATDIAGAEESRVFVMSSHMRSRLELQEYASGGARQLPTIAGAFGITMSTYKGIPILTSDQTRPRAQMGTITLAGSDPGTGTMSNDTYYYKVAPVTVEGEQLASAEANVTLSGGTATQIVTITVTAFQFSDTNSAYSDALYYKVYRGTASSGEVLVATVPALVYNANGTVGSADTTLIDTGLTQTRGGISSSVTDTELLGSTTAPEECVFLVNTDPDNGAQLPASTQKGQAVSENDLVGLKKIGATTDSEPFLVRSYVALAIKRGAAHGVLRNALAA